MDIDTPGTRVKEIGWAYPSSDNAKLFGYGSTGCYILRAGTLPGPLDVVAGCADAAPLQNLAKRFLGDWTPESMFT